MSLNIGHTIDKLQNYHNTSFPILSVYLPITSDEGLYEQYLKLINRSLDKKQQKEMEQDIDYVGGFLQQYNYNNNYQGLAIFSGGNILWEVVQVEGKLPAMVLIDHSPNLEKLFQETSDFQRYLVILADREKAKFFTIRLGEVEEQAEVKGQSVPQKVKGRGASDLHKKINNHIRDHLHRHFQLITDRLNEFVKGKYINGVIIGGHKQFFHDIKKQLPENLQKKVVGEFISELNVNINQIVEESKRVIEKVDKHLNHDTQNKHLTFPHQS